MSLTVSNMLEDLESSTNDSPIPLPNVTGAILSKVIDFCRHRLVHPDPFIKDDKKEEGKPVNREMSDWDKKFCNVPQSTLFEMILAANYLDIKTLLDVTCMTVANMIKGKKSEEIRKIFNITDPGFTEEELAAIEAENKWLTEH